MVLVFAHGVSGCGAGGAAPWAARARWVAFGGFAAGGGGLAPSLLPEPECAFDGGSSEEDPPQAVDVVVGDGCHSRSGLGSRLPGRRSTARCTGVPPRWAGHLGDRPNRFGGVAAWGACPQHRAAPKSCPVAGSAPARPLIGEGELGAEFAGGLSSWGQISCRHRAIFSSSRSAERRTGTCQEYPCRASSLLSPVRVQETW